VPANSGADGVSIRIARFFGHLSYPLYITHYPLIYVYTSWVARDKVPVSLGAPAGAVVLSASIAVAYASLKFYDVPVRRWLSRTCNECLRVAMRIRRPLYELAEKPVLSRNRTDVWNAGA